MAAQNEALQRPVSPPLNSTATSSTIANESRPLQQQEEVHEFSTVHRDKAIGRLTNVFLEKAIPLTVLTWFYTGAWGMTVLAFFSIPLVVTIQGCISLTALRIVFGKRPGPVTPRHGVVVAKPPQSNQHESIKQQTQTQSSEEPEESRVSSYKIPYPPTTFPDREENKADYQFLKNHASKQRPLRLLVMGDSMAVGVGQCIWPTPLMPETVAKCLSAQLGGRPVYWTCHGATGASVGWIIRELERGAHYMGENSDSGNPFAKIPASCSSETDESSCTDGSRGSNTSSGNNTTTTLEDDRSQQPDRRTEEMASHGFVVGTDVEVCNKSCWQTSLQQHRTRFEPHLQGFYDIVVCVTGPNDVKSAVMPFLLTREDSQFRKQAQARGSSFIHDLRLVSETLMRKMQLRVKWIKTSVQTAAESVLESVEDRLHHVASTSNLAARQKIIHTNGGEGDFDDQDDKSEGEPHPPIVETGGATVVTSSLGSEPSQHNQRDPLEHHHHDSNHNPLVVFPGYPNHFIPVFQDIPLDWYCGPPISMYAPLALDILDAHKHDLGCSFPEDILFVPAPGQAEMTEYILQRGELFDSKDKEHIIVSLRDIDESDVEKQQKILQAYYGDSENCIYDTSPFRHLRRWLGFPIATVFKLFGSDGLHCNELGYDAWARYLGRAIAQEWRNREASEQDAVSQSESRQDDSHDHSSSKNKKDN